MSDTAETAPLAVPRHRSAEARRAAGGAPGEGEPGKADRRVLEPRVSIIEIAEREDVSENACTGWFETFSLAACRRRRPSSS
jgi:hypothetical protein